MFEKQTKNIPKENKKNIIIFKLSLSLKKINT